MEFKKCYKCGEEKSLKDFSNCARSKDGKQAACKLCKKAYAEANKERVALKRKEKYLKEKNCPVYQEKVYYRHIKWKYNLDKEVYVNMLSKQDNCCKICSKSFKELDQRPAVDHCHTTGKIRGLLCDTCNRGLGYFKDNIKYIENAIRYLNESRA